MQPSPSPRIPASELRPGRHWYVTAAVSSVVSIVLGMVIAVHQFKSVIDAVDTGNRFAEGKTVTLRLDPDDEKAIWLEDRIGPSRPTCEISGPGDPALTSPGIDVFLTRDETWNPLYTIEVSQAGDYRITCDSERPSEFAIGDLGGLVALGGRLVLAVLLPLFGVGAGIAVVLITAFRRRGHHKRLLAERYGSGAM